MTLIDFILEEDRARYNEIIERATAAKAAAPRKARAPRQMTPEKKQAKIDKLQAQLAALLAQQD